jgi:uncharacterized protein YbjT (DUF2867 family)
MSRRPGEGKPADWVRADLVTNVGLEAAMTGVDVVIHAASAPRRDTRRTDVGGTARLMDMARRVGVKHVIYVSIVGIDRIPFAYYRHKLAAEDVVRTGRVAWTIVRGTQFHDLMDALCRRATRFPVAIFPTDFQGQPIHVDDFADVLWTQVATGPVERAPDVAGPEVLTFGEMLRIWMDAQHLRKPVFQLPLPGRMAAALRAGRATSPDRAVGRITWRSWVSARYQGTPLV